MAKTHGEHQQAGGGKGLPTPAGLPTVSICPFCPSVWSGCLASGPVEGATSHVLSFHRQFFQEVSFFLSLLLFPDKDAGDQLGVRDRGTKHLEGENNIPGNRLMAFRKKGGWLGIHNTSQAGVLVCLYVWGLLLFLSACL